MPACLLMFVFSTVMAQVVDHPIPFDKYPYGAWAVILLFCIAGAVYARFALKATRPFLEDKEVTFFKGMFFGWSWAWALPWLAWWLVF